MHQAQSTVSCFEKYFRYQHAGNYVFLGHTHDSWEINVVFSGELEITYNGEVLILREGMLFLCEPNAYHRSRVLSENGVAMTVYQFYARDLPCLGKPRIYQIDEYLRCLIYLISSECERDGVNTGEAISHNTHIGQTAEQLLHILIKRLIREETHSVYSVDPSAQLFRQAIHYMEENLHRSLCIDEIAHACCASATRIKGVFSTYTGTGVMTHFSAMRIERAKEYLRAGEAVGAVSTKLGFSSQAYFSLCFKKAVGISPKQFQAGTSTADA